MADRFPHADINNRFNHHPAVGDKIDKHETVRREARMLAHSWQENLPEGREKALAITKLEEAMMWANAAIARN